MEKLSIICPVYDEEEVIEEFYNSLSIVLRDLDKNYQSSILFVVDYSIDSSLQILKKLSVKDKNLKIITMTKNFGHQAALLAGIDYSKNADLIIMMDSDLQHPPKFIKKMIAEYENGYELVYTIRTYSKKTNFLKVFFSKYFYKILNLISNIDISVGEADFRLINKKIADIFRNDLREQSLFLRGLFKWIGFKKIALKYKADERMYGKSKYSYLKMISFAFAGIVSFSSKPLQLSIYIGFFLSCVALVLGIYHLVAFFIDSTMPRGFMTLAILITFYSGIQLLFLGVIGHYIGTIFNEVKKRPLYIIDEKINLE